MHPCSRWVVVGSSLLAGGCAAAPLPESNGVTPPPLGSSAASSAETPAPPIASSPPAVAPLRRRVKLSLEAGPAGVGKHDVFLVAPEIQLRRRLFGYDAPGACLLDATTGRGLPRAGKKDRSRVKPPPRPGVWLRCGVLGDRSAGISVTDGLWVDDDLVSNAEGIDFDLPDAAPEPSPACAPDAAPRSFAAVIGFGPRQPDDSPSDRRVVLRFPDLGQVLPLFVVNELEGCQLVQSKQWPWLQGWCRNNHRWRHFSEEHAMMRSIGNKLRIDSDLHSIDDVGASSGAVALPCGAQVRFVAHTILPLKPRQVRGCWDACRAPVGACEDACLALHGTETGEPDEAGVACQRGCNERASACEQRCASAADRKK